MFNDMSAVLRLPIDEVAGLPLHPLVVHAVVVLIPLSAVGLIVMATSGSRSKRYSPAVLLVSGLGMLAAFAAVLSGQEFRETLGLGEEQHFEFGEYLQWVAAALFVVTLVLALLDRRSDGQRSGIGTTVAIVAIVIAVVAIALTVLTGHTGAELVWG
jgi:uncharacterized membrane protein